MPLHHPIDEFDDCPDDSTDEPFDSAAFPGQIPIEKILEMYPPPEETSPPSSTNPQIVTVQPLPSQEPSAASSDSPVAKKKRGAPKGNLNALKHGLYVEYGSIRNTTPIERVQLNDCVDLIAYMKHFIRVTYQKGLKADSINEVNETMRTMSMAVVALSRLINSHESSMAITLPEKLRNKSQLTAEDILNYYKDKLDVLADIVDSPAGPDLDPDLLREEIPDQPGNNQLFSKQFLRPHLNILPVSSTFHRK